MQNTKRNGDELTDFEAELDDVLAELAQLNHGYGYNTGRGGNYSAELRISFDLPAPEVDGGVVHAFDVAFEKGLPVIEAKAAEMIAENKARRESIPAPTEPDEGDLRPAPLEEVHIMSAVLYREPHPEEDAYTYTLQVFL